MLTDRQALDDIANYLAGQQLAKLTTIEYLVYDVLCQKHILSVNFHGVIVLNDN